VLQIGEPTVESNQVTIPVYLSGSVGTGVAAADFRVSYDPNVLRPISAEAGSAAASADKRVMANETASGEYVVVMMGMNQTTFTSGEVVRIVMERAPSAEPSQWKLGLSRPTLSGTDGTIIDSAVAPYTPKDSETKPDSTPDTKPDESNSTPTSESAQGPGAASGTAPMVQGQDLAIPRASSADGNMKGQSAAPNGARKALDEASQARDTARGAIDTPSAVRSESASSETSAQVVENARASDASGASANQWLARDEMKPLHLARIETVESTRSKPEGRTTMAQIPVTRGVGGAWKAVAAGIAAGVAVAILSLFVLGRKVFG